MRLLINGEPKDLPESLNIVDVLRRFDVPSQRVAVELNRSVVRRKDWEHTTVTDGDRIEVVHFVGGG